MASSLARVFRAVSVGTFLGRGAQASSKALICRAYSSKSLKDSLSTELNHERQNYQQSASIAPFIQKSEWNVAENPGDVNITLKKNVNGMDVAVEFQLVAPNFPTEEEDGNDPGVDTQDTTDFTVTCVKPSGEGVLFYCTTVANDGKYRFMVGNVKYFSDSVNRNSITAYTGPEFEDLEESIQSGLDEWLASIGVDDSLCDFIDAMAVDKEQREYIRWLESVTKFIS